MSYGEKDFSLLSHLVIMQNPFCEKNKDAIIVLLNGVSGPGTFGLAEVLTGGRSTDKAIQSERLLGKVNREWAKKEKDVSNERFGVEGIVAVTILPMKREAKAAHEDATTPESETAKEVRKSEDATDPKQTVRDKFYDLREVVKWDFYEKPTLMDVNPRAFSMPMLQQD